MKSAGNCIEPTKNLECHNSPRRIRTIRCTRPKTAVKCKLFPSKVSGDRKSVGISTFFGFGIGSDVTQKTLERWFRVCYCLVYCQTVFHFERTLVRNVGDGLR